MHEKVHRRIKILIGSIFVRYIFYIAEFDKIILLGMRNQHTLDYTNDFFH